MGGWGKNKGRANARPLFFIIALPNRRRVGEVDYGGNDFLHGFSCCGIAVDFHEGEPFVTGVGDFRVERNTTEEPDSGFLGKLFTAAGSEYIVN